VLLLADVLPGAQHLQNPHPLVVHFPIAFLTGAAFVYFLSWITRQESVAWTALWLLVLGAFSAAVAVATGLYAEPGVMVAPSVRESLLVPHKRFMLGNLGLGAVLATWAVVARPLPVRGRFLFLGLLLVLLLGLTKGADYGGRMVYDYNAGGSACGQPIDFTR
jgi:uncharacterized membrane protein